MNNREPESKAILIKSSSEELEEPAPHKHWENKEGGIFSTSAAQEHDNFTQIHKLVWAHDFWQAWGQTDVIYFIKGVSAVLSCSMMESHIHAAVLGNVELKLVHVRNQRMHSDTKQ